MNDRSRSDCQLGPIGPSFCFFLGGILMIGRTLDQTETEVMATKGRNSNGAVGLFSRSRTPILIKVCTLLTLVRFCFVFQSILQNRMYLCRSDSKIIGPLVSPVVWDIEAALSPRPDSGKRIDFLFRQRQCNSTSRHDHFTWALMQKNDEKNHSNHEK